MHIIVIQFSIVFIITTLMISHKCYVNHNFSWKNCFHDAQLKYRNFFKNLSVILT